MLPPTSIPPEAPRPDRGRGGADGPDGSGIDRRPRVAVAAEAQQREGLPLGVGRAGRCGRATAAVGPVAAISVSARRIRLIGT
ncbi:hypothetical protein SR39_07760 [Methylobacterium radiotolerans]|nr:hypothetical protein SR39_07760 [Methylobacterium radiotolerans]